VNKKAIVNGSFDVLHLGHLRLLNRARELADHVLVAIDTDNRVRQLKGNDRPYNTEHERCTLLANLKAVDEVVVFNSAEELVNIIKNYKPDYMVKGSDYKGEYIVGQEYCGEVIFVERDANSTTQKVQDFINR